MTFSKEVSIFFCNKAIQVNINMDCFKPLSIYLKSEKVIFHSTPVYFSVISQSATSVQSFPLTDYQSLSGIIPTDGTTGIYLNYARKTIGTGRRGSLHLSEIYRMHK